MFARLPRRHGPLRRHVGRRAEGGHDVLARQHHAERLVERRPRQLHPEEPARRGPEAYVSLDSDGACRLRLARHPRADAASRRSRRTPILETHAQAINATFAALPRLSHFGIDGLVAGKSQSDAVSLDRLSSTCATGTRSSPRRPTCKIESLTIPRELMQLEPQGAEMLDALGYQDLTLGMSLADRWTPDIGTDQATWTLTIAERGRRGALLYADRAHHRLAAERDRRGRQERRQRGGGDGDAERSRPRAGDAQRHRPLAARPRLRGRRQAAGHDGRRRRPIASRCAPRSPSSSPP